MNAVQINHIRSKEIEKIFDDNKEKVIQMFNSGVSLYEIGLEFKVSQTCVSKHCKRLGLKR